MQLFGPGWAKIWSEWPGCGAGRAVSGRGFAGIRPRCKRGL